MSNVSLFMNTVNILKNGGKVGFCGNHNIIFSLKEEEGLYASSMNGIEEVLNKALFNGFYRACYAGYKNIYGFDVFDIFKIISFQGDFPALFITTNGEVKSDGSAVMGKGIAKQAVDELGQDIMRILGSYIKQYGNRVFNLGNYVIGQNCVRVFSFPTKYSWRDDSDLTLITKSLEQSKEVLNKFECTVAFMPCPGIGNGNLSINTVRPVLDLMTDERYFVCFK